MKIASYIHPIRTYLPCTGIGRHINSVLLHLYQYQNINLVLFFSQQWLGSDGKLDSSCPLRNLPKHTFPMLENRAEHAWKLIGYPLMDRYIADDTDWLYAPMETYIPVKKCPSAVTIHDVQAFETQLPWSNTIRHRWFRYKWSHWISRALSDCRVVFTVSEFSKQRMVDLLEADPDKIVVVGNGIEKSYFDIADIAPSNLSVPFRQPYSLVIGGLRQKKGGNYVLAVADRLRQLDIDLQIAIAGDSEPEFVKAASRFPNITLLGMVSDSDLPVLLRCASSLLFLSPYEGFGIPALEAMAAGTPAVVSDCAALPEIVGDAAIVVNPSESETIAEILIELNNNSSLHRDYSQRGQKHAAQYTWSRCVERVITAFHQFA